MTLFPAIDLKDGQAVRLTKGLMESAKIYSNEPWQLAKTFEEAGSQWLHVVDLNGAFAGKPENLEQIRKIRENCNLKIQLGGGIRDEATIKLYVEEAGLDRVILGSVAANNPEFAMEMAAKYPVAVGIDAIEGMVAVQGWAEVSKVKAVDLGKTFASSDIECIICTDVGRDGTLTGVNVEFSLAMAEASGKPVIASGGVKDLEDIRALAATGRVHGAIIGKAYYEGRLDLQEAFKLI